MKKIKKLKKSDINKNNSTEIKHTINKIKEQEGKYMTILVILFMIIFCVIGYFTLSFNRDKYNNDTNQTIGIAVNSSPNILLTKDDKMEDWLGLKSDVHAIEISNTQSKTVKYQLVFNFDEVDDCDCKNESFNRSDVKYSLDGDRVYNFQNNKENIIKNGTLKAGETEVINIRMWLDSFAETKEEVEQHIHGYFIVNKTMRS